MATSTLTYAWPALFGAMVLLAALPSVSTLTVVTRAASLGQGHGVATAAGIVLADVIYVLIALLGLGAIAQSHDAVFLGLRYLGAAYLLWQATRLWRTAARIAPPSPIARDSLGASVLVGFVLTLGDHKAILFYLAFIPAFIDLTTITAPQIGLILGITIVAVGGTKYLLACLAHRLGQRLTGPATRWPLRLAALVLVAVSLTLLL
jgi:threonine/homoserine/homoserine lactone efflux protein